VPDPAEIDDRIDRATARARGQAARGQGRDRTTDADQLLDTVRPMHHRRWTRLGIVAVAGHLGYELAVGVGVPGAPRLGVRPAVAAYTVMTVAAYRAAGRLAPPLGDRRFAVANGLFASAVISHYTSWPRTTRHGLPWLLECEGIDGSLIAPYNVVLQVSAVAAAGGLIENRSAWPWGVATALVAVPAVRRMTPPEFARLLEQAAAHPGWWNRRLAARVRSGR
jgi:hypothetical protein